MLEDGQEARPTPSALEVELTAHIWNYYRDKRWRVPRYVVEHLNRLSDLSLRLGETIEREGMPTPEVTPDRQLAREARQLGWSLIHRAALLEDGKGDEPIRGSQTGETYKVKTPQRVKECTVRNWVRCLTEESGDRTLTAQIQRQYDAELVLEMKANLLVCFEASKKLYNALKHRKPTGPASEEREANLLNQKRSVKPASLPRVSLLSCFRSRSPGHLRTRSRPARRKHSPRCWSIWEARVLSPQRPSLRRSRWLPVNTWVTRWRPTLYVRQPVTPGNK